MEMSRCSRVETPQTRAGSGRRLLDGRAGIRQERAVRAIAAGLVAAVLALPARGQTTGAIEGRIVDRSQAPLARAVIVASSPALQGETTAVTDDARWFVLSLLPPGSYTLDVQKQGYASFTLEGIAVRADQVTGVQRSMLPRGAPGAAETHALRPPISRPTTRPSHPISPPPIP